VHDDHITEPRGMMDGEEHAHHDLLSMGVHAIEVLEETTAPDVKLPLSTLVAAMVIGTVSLMILGIQPVLLGALAQAHRVTDAQLGVLATIEVLALAVGSGVGPRFMRGGAIRLKTALLAALLAVVDLGVWGANSALMLDLLRGVAGLLEGLILGATIIITIQSANPDRLNAIFLGLSTIPQALLAYFLPVLIMPRYGSNGGFGVLAALSLIAAASALFLVDKVPVQAEQGQAGSKWTPPVILALAAVLLQNAAIGGAWSYLQLLADQHHFSAEIAGIAVAGGLGLQVAGAFAAAAWGRKLSYTTVLIAGGVLQTLVIAGLAAAGLPLAYLGLSFVFGLFWLALSPFQVRLLIALDETRSAALMLTAVTLIGLSIGPALSALGVRGPDVRGAFVIASGLMVAAALLYAALAIPPLRPRPD
jgi:DHA1 family inner membrane transport protein